MRGDDAGQVAVFSYISPEQRVPKDHPLRPLLAIVNDVLERMSPLFAKLYSHTGRPSIPPEKLLRALRPSFVSRARYTSPMPPLPSGSRIS